MDKFLPGRVAISSFGGGGFRFGDMSHQGSLLALPSGMHAWSPVEVATLTPGDFEKLVLEQSRIDILLIGTGKDMVRLPLGFLRGLADVGVSNEFMSTSSAVHTYNVLLAEGRRVAAALIAVGDTNG